MTCGCISWPTWVVVAATVVVAVCLVVIAVMETRRASFPIDLVITWVDPDDAEWRARLHETKVAAGKAAAEAHNAHREPERTSEDITYFAVLSALRHMPWLRTIWLVTERPQRPKWLDRDILYTSRIPIRVVHHDEFFDADIRRPTYNSMVIESQLYNIPELAEHCILSNDDILVLQPTTRGHFFRRDGTPVVHAEARVKNNASTDEQWETTLTKTTELATAVKSPRPMHVPLHTYLPLRKSHGLAVKNALHAHIRAMQPLRTPADFVMQYIVACMQSDIRPAKNARFQYFTHGDKFADSVERDGLPVTVCINNGFSERSIEILKRLLVG